ncbi:hypothetical protein DFQ28_004797 [Apophysomyces sp. BC1034]|nr:hypothetical protein DFQ28_004797 [Apophysomyces sp. BC1034]
MNAALTPDAAAGLVARHTSPAARAVPGHSLLSVLHAIQDELGYLPDGVVAPLARAMNVSRAEVHGVITYYHHFRALPPAGVTVQLCRAESCRAMGSESLAMHAEAHTGCHFDARRHGGDTQNRAQAHEADHAKAGCATTAIELESHVTGDDRQRQAVCEGHAGQVRRRARRCDARRVCGSALMAIRIHVPSDTTAIALGADELAQAIAEQATRRAIQIELIRNGSRGLSWLEPLVEVATSRGRIGYANTEPGDVDALFDVGFHTDEDAVQARAALHPKCVGVVDDIPYLRKQQRLTFARIGIVDPLSIDDYVAHGGLQGLRRALRMAPAAVCQSLIDSGLRGRGGAAFPAGIKWRTVLQAQADQKYVVCNADEGDSGTFSDRLSMECDPYGLIEGMIIAGVSTGATQGHLYVRSEYPLAITRLNAAIANARAAGWLGPDVLGSGRAFELFVSKGAGAYVCGEETALLESLEGKRGIVRAKPPLPALAGYKGKPTVINNVITLASVPIIFARGDAFYRDFGMGRSRGTLPFQLAGNVRHGGLVELAFGATLRELVFEFGGGTASGRPARAIQVGGPLGAYLPESQWDVPLDYEAYTAIGAVLGHGGIVVHDDTANLAGLARYAMHFCALESCGKCTPCRIGSTRGVEVIDRIREMDHDVPARERQVVLLRELCDTMLDGSLCAMGGMTPYPVLSALDHFPEDFGMTRAANSGAPHDPRYSAAA